MKKILINLYEYSLAEVSLDGSMVEFSQNVKLAKNKYPLEMRFYKKGKSGLLYPLEMLIGATEREDIIANANIKEEDNLFEKLYKLSKLDLVSFNGFKILQQ